MEFSPGQIRLNRMHTEVARTSLQENIAESEWTEVRYQARDCFRETHCVVKRELRTPFDVNVLRIVFAILREIGCYEYELFIHYQIDLQPRSMLGSVHDRDIYKSSGNVRNQILGNVDMNAKRYVRA